MRTSKRVFGMLLLMVFATLACNLPVSQFSGQDQAEQQMEELMTQVAASGVTGSLTPAVDQATPATETPGPIPTVETLLAATEVPVLGITPVGPTATLIPGALLPLRPGEKVVAGYVSTPPVIDGNWDDLIAPEYSAASIVYGSAQWTGATDNSARFKVGWNNDFLYIAALVTDDLYVQQAVGYDLYKGDSLEILMDSSLPGDYEVNQLNSDDFQLGISPGKGGIGLNSESYLWFPKGQRGDRSTVVQSAAISVDGGYMIEAAIPWGMFGLVPVNGKRYGFAFSISDNDVPGSQIQQSMVSSSPQRGLTRPKTWGELFLAQ